MVTLPIVVLPTTVELGNVLAPNVSSVALGSISLEFAVLTAVVVATVVGWLVVGGWLAAAMEAEGARIVARDDALGGSEGHETGSGAGPAGVGAGRIAARILAARLIALLPLAAVLSWGSVRLIIAAYYELTSPVEVVTPIIVRVIRSSPEVVIAILVAWTLGEIVGAAAARRITLADDGVFAGLRSAVVTSLRRPLTTLVCFWLPTVAPARRGAAVGRGGRLRVGSHQRCPRAARRPDLRARHGRPVHRPVGRRPAAGRRRIGLAGGGVDGRRGHPGGDVRGTRGPPTG